MNNVTRYSLVLLLWASQVSALYKSQVGQDQFLNDLYFKNKTHGVFIDIGAHDGITLSNTWFFEKELGWKGICFEPLKSVFKTLCENRSCICVNKCVSHKEGTVIFREVQGYSQMLSGIEAHYDPRHLDRIYREIKQLGGSYNFVEVECCVLNNELEKHGFYYIDFLSLDTEGGELTILKSIDFKKFYIYAIAVENNYKDDSIKAFLTSQGFAYVACLGGSDEIYINQN